MINTNLAVNFFDAVKKTANYTSDNTDTSIMEQAQNKATDVEDKSAVTVALEDYTELAKDFHGESKLNLTKKEVDPGFVGKLFNFASKDNVFRSDSAKEFVKDNPNIYRTTIFEMANEADGGIKYAKEDDDIYASALNFAKADIALIEKSYYANGQGNKDGKIDTSETSHLKMDETIQQAFESLDLDGDTSSITAEEYASYIASIDGLMKFGSFDNIGRFDSQTDGKISPEEANLASELSTKKLHDIAKEIYDENYKK